MRRLFIMISAIMSLACSSAFAEDVAITVKQLPTEAQQFLSTNFADVKVLYVTHDKDVTDNDYTVALADGTKIEFDRNGKWKSIENKRNFVPASLIPQSINTYIQTHYSTLKVVQIDRKALGYEVELNSDIELKFDLNGNFIRIDD